MARCAVVTGGTRGLGRAISARLQADGFKVWALYRGDEEAAARCEADLGVSTLRCDVGDFEACGDAVHRIEQASGPVQVLVNNAGVTRDAMLHKMSPEQWRDVIQSDLTSVFNMCRHVIEGMRAQDFGRVVSISSINGQKGQAGQTNYSAAKAGIIGFSKALAAETAKKNITVNVVAPGYCETEMVMAVPGDVRNMIIAGIPKGRLGLPEEVADAVSFLVKDQTSFITGATLAINGGHYMMG
jgi:acetoacetyl-CoA reductase